MSTGSNTCHVVYGKFFSLKCGKNVIVKKAISLSDLENQIRVNHGAKEEYLVALDIFKTKNPRLS